MILVLLVLTAGCSGAGAKSSGPNPSPSPTGDPHAYARELIEPTADLRKAWADWESGCDIGAEIACGLGGLSIAMSAEILTLKLKTWADQSNAHHLKPLVGGEPARLLNETTADAIALQNAAQAYADATCSPMDGLDKVKAECITMKGEIDDAWAKVESDLAQWEKHR